jgi:hypothetical protein
VRSRLHEAGDKVHRLSHGLAVLEADEDDLVAVALGPVPAAVLADEGAAAKLRREGVPGIERQAERRDV